MRRERRQTVYPIAAGRCVAAGVPSRLGASGELQAFVEGGVTANRRGHQEAVAFAEDALDIVGIDVRVSDDDIVLLAEC